MFDKVGETSHSIAFEVSDTMEPGEVPRVCIRSCLCMLMGLYRFLFVFVPTEYCGKTNN